MLKKETLILCCSHSDKRDYKFIRLINQGMLEDIEGKEPNSQTSWLRYLRCMTGASTVQLSCSDPQPTAVISFFRRSFYRL